MNCLVVYPERDKRWMREELMIQKGPKLLRDLRARARGYLPVNTMTCDRCYRRFVCRSRQCRVAGLRLPGHPRRRDRQTVGRRTSGRYRRNFPQAFTHLSNDPRRIQPGWNVGLLSLKNAILSVKDRGGIHAGSQTRMRDGKE